MIAIISCSHYPDDERIYHKEIKSLSLNNLNIKYFTLSDSDMVLSDDRVQHINYKKSRYSITEYINLIQLFFKDTPPTVVHIHEPELLSFAVNTKKTFGAKIIYDVHEDYPSMVDTFSRWNSLIRFVRKKYWVFMEKYFLSYVDEIILASPFIINSDYIYQGFSPVLLENFPLKKFVKNTKTSKKRNSIIYHGNLGPERGIIELVKAMKIVIGEIDNSFLSIYGGFRTKEYEKKVKEIIISLGLSDHIDLNEHIPHSEIWNELRKHEVGVIPFLDNPLTRLGMPTKLFEFMAAGCQLVVPKLTPYSKYKFKGAKKFKAGDINELAKAIIDAFDDIGQHNIQYNKEKVNTSYNWDNNSYKLINLYDRVLS